MAKSELKDLNETIAALCEKHEVDFVYVSKDGQIFLPKAKQHAKAHALKTQTKLTRVSKNGSNLPLEISKSGKPSKVVDIDPGNDSSNKKSEKKPISKMNKTELVEELGDPDITSETQLTKKQLIVLIEKKAEPEVETTTGLEENEEEVANGQSSETSENGSSEGGSQDEQKED